MEVLRQRNMREQRLLEDSLMGKFGMMSRHKNEMAAMAKEQRKLRQDLAKIRKTSSTTWGALPDKGKHVPGDDLTPRRRGRSDGRPREVKEHNRYLQQRAETVPSNTEVSSPVSDENTVDKNNSLSKSRTLSDSSQPNIAVDTTIGNNIGLTPRRQKGHKTSPLSGINVDEARNNAAIRLGSQPAGNNGGVVGAKPGPTKKEVVEPSPRVPYALTPITEADREKTELNTTTTKNMPETQLAKMKGKKCKPTKENESDEPSIRFDSLKYNPDGSVRTVHVMPDFKVSWTEAKKARYIRHKEKPAHEKELTVNQMFSRE